MPHSPIIGHYEDGKARAEPGFWKGCLIFTLVVVGGPILIGSCLAHAVCINCHPEQPAACSEYCPNP